MVSLRGRLAELGPRLERAPADLVYVGRRCTRGGWALAESDWANPFTIRSAGGAANAVEAHRTWLASRPDLIERARRELAGRVLACWCPPGAPCHARTLAALANPAEPPKHVPGHDSGTYPQGRTGYVPGAGHTAGTRPPSGHLPGQCPATVSAPVSGSMAVPVAVHGPVHVVHSAGQSVHLAGPGGRFVAALAAIGADTDRPDMAAVALAYAAAGVPVVPLFAPAGPGACSCTAPGCNRPGKHPRNKGGLSAATTDPDTVRAWWERWPGANVGGLTGVVFDVCDVDGPDGAAVVRSLLGADHGRAPVIRTGSGGWHLLYAPTGLGNRVRFLPGVDWRGVAGYIVLPPSLHACGQRYRPARLAPLTAVPAGLLEALRPAPAVRSVMPQSATRAGYGPAALRRETENVATAPEGGRNHALNRAAFSLGQLVATGQLTEAEVCDGLTDAARCAGLDEREAARTLASGLKAGLARPRTPRTTRRAA